MTIQMWSAGVGFLLPILVSVVNHESWSPWVKAVVALGSSIVAGTVAAFLGGQFNGTNLLTDAGIIFAVSQVSYHTWWKGSDITLWIEQKINIFKPALGGAAGQSENGTSPTGS